MPLSIRIRLYVLFFLSGVSSLVYENAWGRLLGLVLGNTTLATSALLSAFMAGLGAGSFFFGRSQYLKKNPVRVYAACELLIGLYGFLSIFLFKKAGLVYALTSLETPYLPLVIFWQFLFAFLLVFIPAFFMGGTLPILAQAFISETKHSGKVTAALYFTNTLGAFAGVLLSGFWLLPLLGITRTLIFAGTLNIGLAIWSFALPNKSSATAPSTEHNAPPTRMAAQTRPSWIIYSLLLSGVGAMMLEIAWFRILATVLLSTTYAFSAMLASVLVGLAVGSALVRFYLKYFEIKTGFWVTLQALIIVSLMVSMPFFEKSGLWVLHFYSLTRGDSFWMPLSLLGLSFAILAAPCICLGAVFPASVALYDKKTTSKQSAIGFLYSINTLGNIFGAMLAGLLFVPTFGIQNTLLLAVATAIGSAFIPLFTEKTLPAQKRLVWFLSLTGLCLALATQYRPWDARLIMSGVNIRPQFFASLKPNEIFQEIFHNRILFYKDGVNSSICVTQVEGRSLKINGKSDASTELDMPTQLLAGHLPHLLHPNPKQTLIVGFGSGATLAASLAHNLETATCVELEPAVIQAAPYFESVNRKSYEDPRARIIENDARYFLSARSNQYDVIISEPSNPWMAGISNLFTVGFYKLVYDRLRPEGIFCQWVNLYSMDPKDFRMIAATVRSTFPHSTLWLIPQTNDVLIIAAKKPVELNPAQIERFANRSPAIKEDLDELNINEPLALLGFMKLDEENFMEYTTGSVINTDDSQILEFDSAKAVFKNQKAEIVASFNRFDPKIYQGDNVDTRAKIAYGFSIIGDREKAERIFSDILKASPGHPQALTYAGRHYQLIGELETAKELLAKAQTSESRSYLTNVYLSLRQNENALENVEKALASEPGNWKLHYNKGKVLTATRDWNGAAEAYAQAIRLAPKHRLMMGRHFPLKLNLDYSSALIRAKRLVEAQQVLLDLRNHYQTYYPVYKQLKEIYFSTNQLQEAAALYEEAVSMNPYESGFWEDLVEIYQAQGFQAQSRMAMQKLNQLRGENYEKSVLTKAIRREL